jgi:ubiquinone/menaquinone biosynthesis C-methylase UbiE
MNPSNEWEIDAAYDRWADTYDTDDNKTREIAGVVLRQSDLNLSGRDIIEIGCGTGRNTEWLVNQGSTVLALDFSEGMLEQARSRVQSPLARFIRHDIRDVWPAADDSADTIISMLVLEHIEEVEAIFAEASRVLRNGGDLFMCELHPMRQMGGGQAQFVASRTGERVRITAFLHDVSEYVNAGLGYGFEVVHLGEWRDSGAERREPPRLLSIIFRLRK